MSGKRNNKIPLPILALVCACLLFALYTSLSTLALAIWGDSIMGAVDSYDSRLDDNKAWANRSRTVSKGYYFTVDGKKYRGYVMYHSDEAWPRLKEGETRSERISCFSFFPYVNKPSALGDLSQMGEVAIIYHILSPIGCLFLLLLVTGVLKRKRKSKKPDGKTLPPLSDHIRRGTDMFCQNCGAQLSKGAAFCSSCGAKARRDNSNICSACAGAMPQDAAFCIQCGVAANNGEARPPQTDPFVSRGSRDTQHINLVGFSERYNHPEILVAAQKAKQSTIIFMWILVCVALIGFPIAGLLMDDFPFGESIIVGVCIALVMLTFGLFFLRGTKRPMWEGVVANKFSKKKHEHRDDSSIVYTEFTVIITTDAGKKKNIVEKDSRRMMYDYLAVGDRVRYHPKFGTYEKYDKSKDRIIYCNVCSMMNPIQNDRCKRCNNLLFK